MQKNINTFLQNLLLVIVIAAAIYLVFVIYGTTRSKEDNITVPTPGGNTVANSATQIADAGNPIPTEEYVFLYNRDISGLQAYLDSQAGNWLNLSMNIHSGNVYGVATSSQRVESNACSWSDQTKAEDLLCRYVNIEYTAVYKGVLTGGVKADFVLNPVVTLKGDWAEIGRTTKDNKTEVVYGSTAVVTYSGEMCITSVEENTPTLVNDGDSIPDNSYTIKSLDERKFWPDLGPWIFPTGINEDALRLDAYKKAKAIALWPEKVRTLYGFIEDDLRPGGGFYEAVTSFYSPQLATMYGVKGFEIVMVPTPGDPLVRCDGTNVNK